MLDFNAYSGRIGKAWPSVQNGRNSSGDELKVRRIKARIVRFIQKVQYQLNK